MGKNTIFSFCNIYVLLWLAYNMQSMVFGGTGSLIATVIVSALIGISAYYFFYALFHYKMPAYMKGLVLLFAMFTVYGVVLVLSGQRIVRMESFDTVANYNYLKQIYISLLPIFPFYVFTRQGVLNEKLLRIWTVVFVVATLISFSFSQQQQLAMATNGAEEFTNNLGYVFLSIIPLLVFWHHRSVVQYSLLVLLMILVLMCYKRGAIIIGALCVAIFLFQTTKSSSKSQRFWVIFLSVVVIVVGYYFVNYLLDTSDYFNRRLEDTLEGKSSDRGRLYDVYWNYFINETRLLRFLFGNGANATLTISDNYAHNDWLELAINQGLLGIFFYLVYWFKFYKSWKRSKEYKVINLAIGLSLVIYFIKTFFSMSYASMTLYANICIGYCMGMLSVFEEKVKNVAEVGST